MYDREGLAKLKKNSCTRPVKFDEIIINKFKKKTQKEQPSMYAEILLIIPKKLHISYQVVSKLKEP